MIDLQVLFKTLSLMALQMGRSLLGRSTTNKGGLVSDDLAGFMSSEMTVTLIDYEL